MSKRKDIAYGGQAALDRLRRFTEPEPWGAYDPRGAWGGHALIPGTDEQGRLVLRDNWSDPERVYVAVADMDAKP